MSGLSRTVFGRGYGHVPECEIVDELPDIFNDAAAIDPPVGEDDEEEQEPETLF